MKCLFYILSLSTLVAFSSCSSSRYNSEDNNYSQSNYNQSDYNQQPEQNGSITYQQFYDQLSPYGNWVNNQDYGYVWVPNVPGFRPYYNNGHWVYTSYGWTWVSDYNWGWAPFHYGRWTHDMAYGWMWVPGYQWGPAWVSWRGGGDYYGWAPLGPRMEIGASIGSYDSWCFVPRRYINNPRVNNYYVNQTKNVTIINNTTVINNTTNNYTTINKNHTTVINNNNSNNHTVYVAGPSASEVEKSTNTKIIPVKLVNKNTPGTTEINNNALSIYRPPVKAASEQPATVKPAKVFQREELQTNNAGRINASQQPTQQPDNKMIKPEATNPQNTGEMNKGKNENRDQINRPVVKPALQPAENENKGSQPVIKRDPEQNQHNAPMMHHDQPVNLPPGKIGNDIPVINSQPVNKKPENNPNLFQTNKQRKVPIYNQPQQQNQKRNVRIKNARPMQPTGRMPKPPKPIKEKRNENN